MMETKTLLRVDDLVVHFPIRGGWFGRRQGSVKAVDGVSFEIGEAQTVAVVGESGCGKSTVGNAILGLTDATDGRIAFEGREILNAPPGEARAIRQDMQVVFQDPASALNPKLTIGACIAEPMTVAGWERQRRKVRVAELLELVGLPASYMKRYPNELSGGQRQRVVIARALALNPKLMICDEAVSALDVSIRSQILNLLMRLQGELGLSYLFIAHDLSVVRHMADTVIVMYLGTIVEEGPAETVFENPSHPYTQALLAAIPEADPSRQRAKPSFTLEGEIPSPADPPAGCPFVTRCPLREPRCSQSRPKLMPSDHGSDVACFVTATGE